MSKPTVVRLIVPLIACLFAAPSTGQEMMVLPRAEELTAGEGAAFRQCQLALVYERSAQRKTSLPPDYITAMEEEVAFILSDTIFNMPALSYEDSMMRLRFVEDWFVGFGQDMSAALPVVSDPRARAQILLDCKALVWVIMRNHIKTLIEWRSRAMAATETPRLSFAEPPAE